MREAVRVYKNLSPGYPLSLMKLYFLKISQHLKTVPPTLTHELVETFDIHTIMCVSVVYAHLWGGQAVCMCEGVYAHACIHQKLTSDVFLYRSPAALGLQIHGLKFTTKFPKTKECCKLAWWKEPGRARKGEIKRYSKQGKALDFFFTINRLVIVWKKRKR